MSGKIFVGNTSNIATLPKNILVGNPSNIARNVKGIYVGNSQNQAVQVWPNGRVPVGYQEVEYIRSVYKTNTFYTGIKPNSNTRIVIDFMYTDILFSYADNFGRQPSSPFYTSENEEIFYYSGYQLTLNSVQNADYTTDFYFRVCFGSKYYNIYSLHQGTSSPDWSEAYNYFYPKLVNKKMTVDLNRNRGTLYIDGGLVKTFDNTFSQLGNEIRLLSYYHGSQFSYTEAWNKINLYSCQIYQNNVLVRDFIPCYHKTTYGVYLYDRVNGTLYQCNNSSQYPPYLGPDV